MKQWMRAALLIWLLVPGTLWAQAVIVPTIIPLAEDNTVPNKIAADCNISQSIFEGSQPAALEAGITLQHSDAVTRTAAGRTLNLFITDAISSGNAFIGHKKSVTVVGKLYENGQQIGSFQARRNSGGGAFAGYKSSCAVIHRCGRVVSQDIGQWLRAPSEGARLGDL